MKEKFRLADYNDYVEDFTQYDFTTKELVVMKCHECSAYNAIEAKMCPAKGCPLYPLKEKWYKIPRKKYNLSDEELERRKNNMFKK